MILVEIWATLVFNPSSPHYILVAVGYHLNAALGFVSLVIECIMVITLEE